MSAEDVRRGLRCYRHTLGPVARVLLLGMGVVAALASAALCYVTQISTQSLLVLVLTFVLLLTLARHLNAFWLLAVAMAFYTFVPSFSSFGLPCMTIWLLITLVVFALKAPTTFLRALKITPWWIFIFFAVGFFFAMQDAYVLAPQDHHTQNTLTLDVTFFICYVVSIFLLPTFYSLTIPDLAQRPFFQTLFAILPLGYLMLIASFGTPSTMISETGWVYKYRFFDYEITNNRTQISFMLSICVTTFIAMALTMLSRRTAMLLLLLALLALAVQYISGGRAGLLFLLLTWIIVGVIRFQTHIRLRNTAILVCMLVVFVVLALVKYGDTIGTVFTTRWSGLGESTFRDTSREERWMSALQQVAHRPFGVGWTTHAVDIDDNIAHNDYLAYSISYGVLGGLGYLLLVMMIILRSYAIIRRTGPNVQRRLGTITFAVSVCLLLNSMTDHLIGDLSRFIIVWSIIALGLFDPHSAAHNVVLSRHGSFMENSAFEIPNTPGSSLGSAGEKGT